MDSSAARGAGAGRGGFEDILRDVFGGLGGAGRGRGRGGRSAQFEPEDFVQEAPPARDLEATLTISLEDAAQGATKRLHLPTGKDVDVKISRRHHQRSADQAQGPRLCEPMGRRRAGRRQDHHNDCAASALHVDGSDLRLDLPITLYEAVLGGKVRVPTLDGAVELAIPPNTNGGRTFRLRGKGLSAKSGHGDLLATVRIVLPEEADDELKELMRKWRDGKPYDPRNNQG